MPESGALLAFAFTSAVIVLVPGPSVLFVIGRSLSLGRRGGLASVIGNELGALPLVAAVAFGVGAVVAESVVVFSVVKEVGAAYLVYLGVQAIRHRADRSEGPAVERLEARSLGALVGQGAVVGVTNPKTIVFFVAVLPQFVDFRAGGVPGQMMVLGLVFVLVAFVLDSVWALAASTAREWFARSPRRLARVRATGGGMMIALGGAVALTGSKG